MTIDRHWFETQLEEFTRGRPLYELQADTLRPILNRVAQLLCPSAIVQVRVKSVQSFAEKTRRKYEKDPARTRQFTDLCGGRIITQLQSEAEDVCRFLRDHFTIDEAHSLDTISRLSRREFGYRSVHYIVQFKRGAFPTAQVPVSVPDELYPLKAEIQVRTLLQHAWAEMDHERLYLPLFKVPDHLDRESARLAAAMESADADFSRFADALEAYRSDDGGHTEEKAVREEIALLQAVRKHAGHDEALAHQVAQLCLRVRDWETVIRLLDDIPAPCNASLLCRIGHALCEQYQTDCRNPEYRRGRQFLERALLANPRRVEPHLRLAETYIREGKLADVYGHYARAFETAPSDPQALCGYIRYRIATERNLEFLPLLRPTLATAVERCRAQAEADLNLPWAFYHGGELQMLLGPEQELIALNSYLRAIQASSSPHLLEQALEGLELMRPVERDLPVIGLVRRLLVLGLAVRSHPVPPDVSHRLSRLKSPGVTGPDAGSVAIVAGGCDPALQDELEKYRALLIAAFARFRGTVFSGGTREGIAGLVGELGETYRGQILTIAYEPAVIPNDGTANPDRSAYHDPPHHRGAGFHRFFRARSSVGSTCSRSRSNSRSRSRPRH